MPQRNVEILREMYEAFNRGDLGTALEVIDPGIEWRITPEAGPAPGTYHGHGGVRSAFSSMLEVWADYQTEPLDFTQSGDFVVVTVALQATGKSSRAGVEAEVAHLWRVHAGKVVLFEAHSNRRKALAAARRATREE
jgi:uncharacterized protein